MPAIKTFSGRRLRELRERAGLSREQVAVEIKRSWVAVYGYERDTLTPGREALEALAHLFSVTVDDFYEDGRDA